MQLIENIGPLRQQVLQWRMAGDSIALVPTMGNLHAGHLKLVQKAKAVANRVVVSIFVNPTQFCPGEDFEAYPRTLEKDCEALVSCAVDLVFAPDSGSLYSPNGSQAFVEVEGLSDTLCGAVRPGHFRGVTTIVSKLFNLVQPDFAVFGEKDYQQLAIIRKMVDELNFPVEIIGQPTERESSGLALSSRNGFLSAQQREQAAVLFKALQTARNLLLTSTRGFAEIEQGQIRFLEENGFKVDYFSIRRADDLGVPDVHDCSLVILVAARVGETRLIDNLLFNRT